MCNEKLHVEELKLVCEDLRDWRYRLEKALEYEQDLNRKLREENEDLQNKIRIYQEHIERNREDEPLDEADDILNNLSNAINKARASFKHNDDDFIGI